MLTYVVLLSPHNENSINTVMAECRGNTAIVAGTGRTASMTTAGSATNIAVATISVTLN